MSVFRFKHFSIDQSKVAMKVGTDGVLLGAWAEVSNKASRILDVGAGSGLICLQMAQRYPTSKILGIERDQGAASAALANISNSAFSERIAILEDDFVSWYPNCEERFDAVVSNPPFFDESPKEVHDARHLARQSAYLPLDVLVKGAARLLVVDGSFSVILPYEQATELQRIAASYGLELKRYCLVKGRSDTPVRRVLFDFVKTKNPIIAHREELVIELDRNIYTEEYRELTAPFYLNF